MLRAQQLELTARLAHLIETGTTDMAPATMELPVETYVSPRRHRLEIERLFSRRPMAVAFASEVEAPGQFVTVDAGRTPLVVCRDDGGTLHALVNACRHRGARVEQRERGCARRFTCRYHAWTYHLDGRLDAVPAPAGFEGMDRAERGLLQWPAEIRHGLVWVEPPGGARQGVAHHLGATLDAELSAYGLDDFVALHDRTVPVAANWKLAMDGFLESYHLRSLHRATVAPYFFCNTNTVDGYGEHLRLALPKRRLERMLADPGATDTVLDHTTIVYAVMPGTVILWQAGHLEIFLVRPDPERPGHSTMRVGLLAPRTRVDEEALWARNWQRVIDTVTAEDLPQAEEVQTGLAATAQPSFLIGRNELGLQRFYQGVAAALED